LGEGLGVSLGDGTGAFGPAVFTAIPQGETGSISFGAGDLNGDGTIDVASGSFQSSRTTIFFNGPTVSIQASARAASEDGQKGKFSITRNGCDTQALTVFYTLGGTATNGVDYRTLKGRVKIPAGKDSATITVAPIDDSIPEGTETVVLTLSAETTYGITGAASATVSILDND
ncbi:MAG TPA: Calx-beta domain-containing protein, partial [Chthoniobacterales bacterium]